MKRLMKFASVLAILTLVLSLSLISPNSAQAGQLASISVLLKATDSQTGNNVYTTSTAVPYTFINFDPVSNLSSAVDDYDGIKLTFTEFTDAVVTDDVTVTQNSESLSKTVTTDSAGVISIVLTSAASSGHEADPVTIKIANSHLTTPADPSAAGEYVVTIQTYDLGDDEAFGGVDTAADTLKDSGSALVIIGDAGDYDVEITGTVAPTLSLTVSPQQCAFGTITKDYIYSCQYTTTVATNATGGYTSFIRTTTGLMSGSDEIGDLQTSGADVSIAIGTESYGVATDGTTDLDINHGVTCPVNGATTDSLTATDLALNDDMSLAQSTGPEAGDATVVCHLAGISGVTEAGNYTQTVTITAVGNF